MVYLHELDDVEFGELVSKAIHQRYVWPQFLEPELLDKTRAALVELRTTLIAKVENLGEQADMDWSRRIHHKIRLIDARLSRVNSAIKTEKNTRHHNVEQASTKYLHLAFELAKALSASNNSFMLDEIFLQDITARDWLERRSDMLMDKEGQV